jgi:hypothetical protein
LQASFSLQLPSLIVAFAFIQLSRPLQELTRVIIKRKVRKGREMGWGTHRKISENMILPKPWLKNSTVSDAGKGKVRK